MVKVAINGFGRIGRLVLRASWGWPELEFVHINEIKGGSVAAAHLLKFDSVHGRWQPEVEATTEAEVQVDGKPLSFSEYSNPWRGSLGGVGDRYRVGMLRQVSYP
jgi:glyceraldehyde 3-phosphate dehydrogenase